LSPIQAIGQFWEKDAEGFLINPSESNKVDASLWPLLDLACDCLQAHFGQDLLAVYLRGSAARGIPKEFWGDLDLVALLRWDGKAEFMRWVQADQDLLQILPDFGETGLDLAIAHHQPEMPGKNPSVKMLLKTQALCIWGDDLSANFPPYKVGPDLAIHGKWLRSDRNHWMQMRKHWPSPSSEADWLKSFWKTTIRAGMEACMAKTGQFSADLQPCLLLFSECHPQHAAQMEKVMECYLDPELSVQLAPQLMEEFLPVLIAWVDAQGDAPRQA
jgi:hypothetical protein